MLRTAEYRPVLAAKSFYEMLLRTQFGGKQCRLRAASTF